MIVGLLYSILAGLLISLQGVFNARVSEKIGAWQTNAIVHGSGLLLVFLILTLRKDWHFEGLGGVNRLYLVGGLLGVFIVLFVMKGITRIGASYAVTIIIVSQIIVTLIINRFGFFREPATAITPPQFAGLLLMIAGVVLYQGR